MNKIMQWIYKSTMPNIGDKYVLESHEDDPFTKNLFIVTVVDMKDGWIKYRDVNGMEDAKKVSGFLSIFRLEKMR